MAPERRKVPPDLAECMIYIKHVREILDETRRDVDGCNVRLTKLEHDVSENRHGLRNHLEHHTWSHKTAAIRTEFPPDKPFLTSKQKQKLIGAGLAFIAALTLAVQDCGKTMDVLRGVFAGDAAAPPPEVYKSEQPTTKR